MYRFLYGLVACLGLVVLALPGGVRADNVLTPTDAVNEEAELDALVAALSAVDVADMTAVTDKFGHTVLLDDETAGVTLDTNLVTTEGFTTLLKIRDELGLVVWTDYAQVAPNGTLQFIIDPTLLLQRSGGLTLDVLQYNASTNVVSVAATFNLMPLMMAGVDSVSQSVLNAIATGNITLLRQMIADAALTGGYTAAEVAAMEAAVARLAAAAAAATARQAAIAAAQQAGRLTLQRVPVGSNAFNAARGSIMRAFFEYGYTPVYNAFNAAIMRSYIAAANAVIASYTATLARLTDPARIAEFQRKIALQQARIAQITAWFTANGQTP